MKRKANKLIIGIIFLAGLSLLLYPFVANQWNNYRQKQLISSYEQTVSEKDAAHEIDYDAELQKAEAYNEALLPSILPDSFAVAAASDKEDQSYMDALNIAGDEMMGIVEIPTDEDVLKQAAGHLEGSSLPIGGKSTHAVISAHRGLPSASLFTDLDQLEEGDHFLIHVLNETLCYEVDKISVVKHFLPVLHTESIPSGFWSVVTEYLMWNRKLPMRRHRSAESVFIQIIFYG